MPKIQINSRVLQQIGWKKIGEENLTLNNRLSKLKAETKDKMYWLIYFSFISFETFIGIKQNLNSCQVNIYILIISHGKV